MDMWGQVYRQGIDTHGDFHLECSNSTSNVTLSPTMAPMSTSCADDQNAEFAELEGQYVALMPLDSLGKAHVFWNKTVTGIAATMLVNDGFGWLAMGTPYSGSDGDHPNMNGAKIIMAYEDHFPEVHERQVATFTISLDLSAFRWWKDTAQTQAGATIVADSCFTKMTFELPFSAGVFSADQSKLMFGYHPTTKYMGYHGFMNRGVVDWDLDQIGAPSTSPTNSIVLESSAASGLAPAALGLIGLLAL
jgi:hypothetical protein